MTASLGGSGSTLFSAVQLVFVLDTSPYMGAYDPTSVDPGYDACAAASTGTHLPCLESNGLPFFVAHAADVAAAIQAAHPRVNVSFALVDYFATYDAFDDRDGATYHVDVGNFTSDAGAFGQEVVSTFQHDVLGGAYVYNDSDMSDNILHSSSITALYGALNGVGLDWLNSTHHVIVWVGATAPRDANYVQNYCVSPWVGAPTATCTGSAPTGFSPACEPSYTFASVGPSPNCEGWVASHDGNATHSIAADSVIAPSCVASLGGRCTVDTIDLWTTPTDPNSTGWPTSPSGGGPGSANVTQNTRRVLLAGCDLANATGGSWDGPRYFSCPRRAPGTLTFVDHGNATRPTTSNPSLLRALANVSFGEAAAYSAPKDLPMFSFRPWAGVSLAATPDFSTNCTAGGRPVTSCSTLPTAVVANGTPYLTWNFSANASANLLGPGDSWSASFNVVLSSPSQGWVPLDACTTAECVANGSGPLSGLFTAFRYSAGPQAQVNAQSFPLATVELFQPSALAVGANATPGTGYAPLPVKLTLTAAGGAPPYTVTWSFEDASPPVDGTSVSHTFGQVGTYPVEAQVTDLAGQHATAGVTILVLPAPAVLITIAHSNRSATDVGVPVNLSANSSGGVAPYAYSWTGLPEGCSSAPVAWLDCVPARSGTFVIAVQAHDARGNASAPFSLGLTVAPDPSLNLTALPWGNCTGTTPGAFGLSLAANISGGHPPFVYNWSLGDGSTSSDPIVTHPYPRSGPYTVVLRIHDSVGGAAARTLTATATPASCTGLSSGNDPAGSLIGAWSGVILLVVGGIVVAAAVGVGLRRRFQRG